MRPVSLLPILSRALAAPVALAPASPIGPGPLPFVQARARGAGTSAARRGGARLSGLGAR